MTDYHWTYCGTCRAKRCTHDGICYGCNQRAGVISSQLEEDELRDAEKLYRNIDRIFPDNGVRYVE